MSRKNQKIWLYCSAITLAVNGAWAQQLPSIQSVSASSLPVQNTQIAPLAHSLTLKQAFDAAWKRHPEAQLQLVRQNAAMARKQAADVWSPEPLSVELSVKTDQLFKNQGNRELVAGVSVPIWLPGERAGAVALADAEIRSLPSRISAAQLRTAASVREAYWQWHRTRIAHELTGERLRSAQQLSMDVAKRVKAGDLAKADQHQADVAVSSAELSVAEALGAVLAAAQQLKMLVGEAGFATAQPAIDVVASTELKPEFQGNSVASLDKHPALVELLDRVEVAQRNVDLVLRQTRANPVLSLALSQGKGQSADPYQQAITVGVSIPFGADSRNRVKSTAAQAEALEALTLSNLEKDRLMMQLNAARQYLESVQAQIVAANKRAILAQELRGFIQKSFRFGQSDLPTYLRIEAEAVEAERQAALIRVDLAASISALRQALGLLPA